MCRSRRICSVNHECWLGPIPWILQPEFYPGWNYDVDMIHLWEILITFRQTTVQDRQFWPPEYGPIRLGVRFDNELCYFVTGACDKSVNATRKREGLRTDKTLFAAVVSFEAVSPLQYCEKRGLMRQFKEFLPARSFNEKHVSPRAILILGSIAVNEILYDPSSSSSLVC
jgi:hypothetical protein